MSTKKLFILFFLIIIILAGTVLCLILRQPGEIETVSAYITTESIEVFPAVSGKIKDIKVKQSEKVKKDQLLAEIITPAVYPDNEKSSNSTANAEKDYENAALMYKDGVISREEYDALLKNYKRTKNNARNSRENSAQPDKTALIYSPADGTVVLNNLKPGDTVDKDSVIARINSEHKEVTAYFSALHSKKFKPGNIADIFIIKYPEKRFNGIVDSINPPEMQGVPVNITFTEDISALDLQNGDSVIVKVRLK